MSELRSFGPFNSSDFSLISSLELLSLDFFAFRRSLALSGVSLSEVVLGLFWPLGGDALAVAAGIYDFI